MRCIIAGSRDITDYAVVEAAMEGCGFADEIAVVVSGRQRGVDKLGERWARSRGLPVDPHPAEWGRFKRAAGPIRNHEMAEVADALVAIPRGGPGTADMIAVATKRGLRVYVHRVEA